MLDKYLDQFKAAISLIKDQIKRRIFGSNNETLDFVMDSFYKLSPSQQTGVLVGVGAGIAILLLSAIGFYYAKVDRLQRELEDGFAALHDLQQLKQEYKTEEMRFRKLVQIVEKKTSALRAKPFFEKISKDLGVQLEGLNDQNVAFDVTNPLSKEMKYVEVDVRFPKISLPRLLKILTEVEKSNNFYTVESLIIRSRYGTRLYFDAQAKVRGYQTGA